MKLGTVAILIAASMLSTQQGEVRTQQTQEVHFRAIIESVVPLSDFAGEVTPVHFDPRFALTLRVESADPSVGRLSAGSLVTLAIHSPSKVFEGEPRKGNLYAFRVYQKVEDGRVSLFGLSLDHRSDSR